MTANDLEHRYYRYLRAQSYITEAALNDVLRGYLPYFKGFTNVLDIGCGHGEFLQLLEGHGHTAVGVDIDPAMVESCHAKGLTAFDGDAIEWLTTQTTTFDAIFSSNVIEHLDAASVQALIRAASQALRPGGLLLLGTPNPESAIVQFREFWRDPTHVRLYDRQLLEFFFNDAGFTAVQTGNNAASAWEGVEQMVDPAVHPAVPVPTPDEEMPAPPVPPTLGELHPLPQPPATDAPLRQRLAFRLLQFVYQKFMEPYVALLRHDQARLQQELHDQRTYTLALHSYATELRAANQTLTDTLRATVQQQEARFEQVGYALRFLFPPRECFVYGYKPPAPEAEHAEVTSTAEHSTHPPDSSPVADSQG